MHSDMGYYSGSFKFWSKKYIVTNNNTINSQLFKKNDIWKLGEECEANPPFLR